MHVTTERAARVSRTRSREARLGGGTLIITASMALIFACSNSDPARGRGGPGGQGGVGGMGGATPLAGNAGFPYSSACDNVLPFGETLLELGDAGESHVDDQHLLTLGTRWTLRDAVTGTIIAEAPVDCRIVVAGTHVACGSKNNAVLAGPIFAIRTGQSTVQVRSASDGHLIASVEHFSVDPDAEFGAAQDGSYVWATSRDGLSMWSQAGVLLATRTGDYSTAKGFAGVDALRVANGPAGSAVIEAIAPTGVTTVSAPFAGSFHSWFVDGERFFTVAGPNVSIRAKDGVQQQIIALSTDGMAGAGQFFITNSSESGAGGDPVRLFRVGDSPSASTVLSPEGTLARARFSGNHLAITVGGEVDLFRVGDAVTKEDHFTLGGYRNAGVFEAQVSPSGVWVASASGVILHRPPGAGSPVRGLNCGGVLYMAATDEPGGLLAVATAIHGVLVIDPRTRQMVTHLPVIAATIQTPFTGETIQMSDDGTVLAVQGDIGDGLEDRLTVFSLPSGAIVYSSPPNVAGGDARAGFALSRDGTRIGDLRCGPSPNPGLSSQLCTLSVTDLVHTTTYATWPQAALGFQLSPTGVNVALPEASSIDIYQGGSLTGAVEGLAVAWIDDSRLLILADAVVQVDHTGARVAVPAIPYSTVPGSFVPVQVVDGGTRIYAKQQNAIYDLAMGRVVWQAPHDGTAGAIVGSSISYLSGTTIKVVPR